MNVLVTGPPAVGKTTVATRLQARLAELGLPFRVVDSDEFSHDTYDRLYERVNETESNWVVAGTFYKRHWQERFQALPDTVLVLLWTDLTTCLERNRQRADPIDEAAVHIIWREFDDPDADLVVDVTDLSPSDVVDRIVALLGPAPETWG